MKSKRSKAFELKLPGREYDIEFTEFKKFGSHAGFNCSLVRGYATEISQSRLIRLDAIIGRRQSPDNLSTDFVVIGPTTKRKIFELNELVEWMRILLAARLFQGKKATRKGFIYLLYHQGQKRAFSFSWQKLGSPLRSWPMETGRPVISIRPHLLAELDPETFEVIQKLEVPGPPQTELIDL